MPKSRARLGIMTILVFLSPTAAPSAQPTPTVSARADTKTYPFQGWTIRTRVHVSGGLDDPGSGKVEVLKGRDVGASADLGAMEAVGGWASITPFKKQPFKALFLLEKLGDYNPRLVIVTSRGKIFNLPSGQLFRSPDDRIISLRAGGPDGSAYAVFDVSKQETLLSREEATELDHWFGFTFDLYQAGDQIAAIPSKFWEAPSAQEAAAALNKESDKMLKLDWAAKKFQSMNRDAAFLRKARKLDEIKLPRPSS